ncbi:Uncharacterised protein [Burkholderia pseudomallei]|nr:Uncharacterised protein [Burkholderia pseudomallei]
MRHITMTVEEWAAVPDNPIQRDTERHAKFAKTRHLSMPAAPQALVAAAYVREGNLGLVKVDGHTRAWLWTRGELDAPPEIAVTVYEVETMREASDLYRMYDSIDAAETPGDKVSGAYRLHGIVPKSYVIKRGALSSVFRLINGNRRLDAPYNIYYWVGVFKRELELIDSYHFNHHRLVSGLLVAALIGTRKHGEVALEFFERYCADDGSKVGRERDAVEGLAETLKQRAARGLVGGGTANVEAIAALGLAALEKFLRDEDVRRTLKPIELRAYINSVLYRKVGPRGVTRAEKASSRVAFDPPYAE